MDPMLEHLRDDNKKRKTYSRILTNKMTIVAYKLFCDNPKMHIAFILYRLEKDFGFTQWEVANFTGIPMRYIARWVRNVKRVLDLEVLKVLSRMDFEKEMAAWDNIKDEKEHGPQGYQRDKSPWFLSRKKLSYFDINRTPYFAIGGNAEKYYEEKIARKSAGQGEAGQSRSDSPVGGSGETPKTEAG